MTHQWDRYVHELHREVRLWPAWTPGTRISLGDCGPLVDGVFDRQRNVTDYGITFEEYPSNAEQNYGHLSKGAVSLTFQAKADVNQLSPEIPKGSAGVVVEFSQDGAVVFQAPKSREYAVRDVVQLQRDLVSAALRPADANAFPPNFVVVTKVVRAPSATALISQSSSARLVLSAAADLTLGPASLADAHAKLAVKSIRNVATQLLATGETTPLFGGIALHVDWYGEITGAGPALDQPLPFDDLG